MGANATTFVPAYVSGEVLTAADLTVTNSGIPVFADSTARTAAFGGTGEKVLAEGQYAYLESDNSTSFWDGSAWQPVGTTPGLAFITGAAFTTATSFSLPDSTFTSTYKNYKIIVNLTALTADAAFTMRLRASGTDNTGNNYNTGYRGVGSDGGSDVQSSLNSSNWVLGESDTSVFYNLSMDLFNPQVVANTTHVGQYTFVNTSATAHIMRSGGAQFTGTTQFDSVSFISNVASSMTGVYRVYGYSES
jgi:hypothetical protein